MKAALKALHLVELTSHYFIAFITIVLCFSPFPDPMKQCPYCVEDIQDAATKCKHCGEFIDGWSDKKIPNKNLAGIFALFLGGFGVHKFYQGKPGQGFLYLIFCWTFIPSIIGFIEALVLFFTSEEAYAAKFGGGRSAKKKKTWDDLKRWEKVCVVISAIVISLVFALEFA